MKRLSAALVVLSLFCAASTQNANAADSNFCPPGAKFCPAPGLSGGGSGQYDMNPVASAPSGFGVQAHFESQLNEGEQLIMVAPNEQNGMIITPNPAAYADSGYSNSYSSDVYSADTYSSSPYSTDVYSADSSYSSDTYSAAPVQSYDQNFSGYDSSFSSSGGYASSGFSDTTYSDNSSSLGGGYIPPPPGGGSFGDGYSAEPAIAAGNIQSAPPPPLSSSSFGMEDDHMAMQPSTGRNYRPKNGGATSAPAPKSFQRDYYSSTPETAEARYDNDSMGGMDDYGSTPPRQAVSRSRGGADTIPSREEVAQNRTVKKKRAEAMSEVANESYRRPEKKSGGYSPMPADKRVSKAPAERVPWWKGGMWRNRGADKAEKEAAKAEAKARKAEIKAAKQKNKNR